MTTLCALLYTDVVESTKLAATLGEAAMSSLWRAHDRAARDLLVAWRGREIEKTDGLLLTFDSAADAAGYAIAYHRALAALDPPLKTRAGLHVAHVSLRANTAADMARGAIPVEVEGFAKPVVSRAMAAAMGGQTLMTADARLALGVTELNTQSHGHWRFKGLAEPIEVFEVGDSTSPFLPPPDSEKAYRVVRHGDFWQPLRQIANNLPAERDRFVGRQGPLHALMAKFDQGARLVSVVGVGGVGKTRLAIRFARTWLGEFPGGVWFCDLAQARTLDGIFFEVAQALEVPLGKTDPQVQLAHAIAGRGECLVVFDNFEQVARHADNTLGRWLDKAIQAKFLVTTREVLGIAGEDTLALGPLPTDEAASLFIRRAEAVKHEYRPTEGEKQLIEQLVAMLDGLPLAIELAAARVRVMSPRVLLGRMNDRFKLLWSAGRRRDRQATLRATFDWSWDLLSEFERSTLAQLSVFEGGFTLESAEAVVNLPTIADPLWMPDLLQGLVDKSFVRTVSDDRFELLESIREYSAEHLRTEGRYAGSGPIASTDAQIRHCRYFAGFDAPAAAARNGVEANNLVAACRHACELGDADSAVGALDGSWSALRLRGPFRVIVDLADRVQAMPTLEVRHRTTVDWVAGSANLVLGKAAAAQAHLNAGLEVARSARDRHNEARFLCALGEQREPGSDPNLAFPILAEALSIAAEVGDDELACRAKSAQGILCYELGHFAEARQHYEEALARARQIDDKRWQGGILGNLGILMFGEGQLDEAQALYAECLAIAQRTGDRRWEGNMRCNLGMLRFEKGSIEQARIDFEESLAMARAMGHARLECTVLCNLGIVLEASGESAAARDRYEAAVRLANELADRRTEGQFRGYLGSLLARTGNTDAGLVCLGLGEQLLLQASDSLSLGLLLCRKAEAEHRSGRGADAAHALRRVEAIASSANASPRSELGKALASLSEKLKGREVTDSRSQ